MAALENIGMAALRRAQKAMPYVMLQSTRAAGYAFVVQCPESTMSTTTERHVCLGISSRRLHAALYALFIWRHHLKWNTARDMV